MPITLPENPTDGQTYTEGDLSFTYNASKTRWVSSSLAPYDARSIPEATRIALEIEVDPLASDPPTYVRPVDWLTLPTVSPTEQKVVMLVAVYPSSNVFTFSIDGANFTIDWGDGTTETQADGTTNASLGLDFVHEYDFNTIDPATETASGYRQAIITITADVGQDITGFYLATRNDASPIGNTANYNMSYLDIVLSLPNATEVYFNSRQRLSGSNKAADLQQVNVLSSAVTSMSYMFRELTNLQKISFVSSAQITSMINTFEDCESLIEFGTFDVDTSTCTNFSSVFHGCAVLAFTPDMDTSAGTSCSEFFNGCNALREVNPTYDFSSAVSVTNLFYNCYSLIEMPAINLSSASSLNSVFRNCRNLVRIHSNTVWPDFQANGVTNLYALFSDCHKLAELPSFNTSGVTSMRSFAERCYNLKEIPSYDTSSVQSLGYAFYFCTSLKEVSLDFSNVTEMFSIFRSCSNLEKVNILGQTTNCTEFGSAFYACSSLRVAPDFDYSSALNMSFMYSNCQSLIEVPVINAPHAADLAYMFQTCSGLREITLNATSTNKDSDAFRGFVTSCRSLKQLNGTLDCTGVEQFQYMFYQCSALEKIPFLDFSNATNLQQIFESAQSITSVDFTPPTGSCSYFKMFDDSESLKSFPDMNLANATSLSDMFSDTESLFDVSGLTNIAKTISFFNSNLGRQDIVNMFNNLSTVVSETVNVAGCRGVSELSATDIEIATNKGWTVTT